jgi:putative peptidoglycan lipid II flippase
VSEPAESIDPSVPQEPPQPPEKTPRSRAGAASVFAGIVLSRIMGFVREGAFARYFGVGPHQDALTAAMRVPNVLQNLLGEGALSASFIPIYSGLLEEGRDEEAGKFAGAIFGLMAAAAAAFALLGILLAKPIVVLLAPGFLRDAAAVAAGRMAVDRFALSVIGIRILFPMTGLLVLSVWALAILNSNRRFFLPYFAPVLWNSAIIAALVIVGRQLAGAHGAAEQIQLFKAACWGAFAGGLLQFLVQLPMVLGILRGFRPSFSLSVPGVREALRAWWPAVAGRGVVQLAGYIDLFLATSLATGAASADRFAQMFYLLPISLFGISVAASELPEMSRLRGEGAAPALLARVRRSLSYVAFLNIPTVVGYLAFGYLIVGFYRRGNFGVADNWLVYLVLCGYSTGILATTTSRLLQNTFYALGDTRSPARIAAIRVGTSVLVAVPLMFLLDRFPLASLIGPFVGPLPGRTLFLGSVGLALASGFGAWMELYQLRRALRRRLPEFTLPWRDDARMALLALAATLPAALVWWLLPPLRPIFKAVVVLGIYGMSYLLLAKLARLDEVELLLAGVRRRLKR